MIKKIVLLITVVLCICILTLSACSKNTLSATPNKLNNLSFISKDITLETDNSNKEMDESNEMIAVSIAVDNKTFSAKFHNNESTKAILSQMPFTLDMRDFSSQEKVAPLSFDLPNANTQIPSSIHSGEIYLWSGNQLVLFYTSFSSNSYAYVPVGSIEEIEELTEALGSDNVTITFSIK